MYHTCNMYLFSGDTRHISKTFSRLTLTKDFMLWEGSVCREKIDWSSSSKSRDSPSSADLECSFLKSVFKKKKKKKR